jgi:hypothetical protein
VTPLIAVVQPEKVDTAGTGAWGRQLATIRAYYGDDWFSGRSVLALACGQEIDELIQLGARVVRIPDGFDPDCDWPIGQMDLVLHLGLLSQLDVSHASLRHACAHASHLVVETAVCDSHDEDLLVCIRPSPGLSSSGLSSPEPPPSLLRSYGGQADVEPGIYPSPARIERLLTEHGMLFQRLADSRTNGPAQIYDWLATGTGRVTRGHRRLWFARKG